MLQFFFQKSNKEWMRPAAKNLPNSAYSINIFATYYTNKNKHHLIITEKNKRKFILKTTRRLNES